MFSKLKFPVNAGFSRLWPTAVAGLALAGCMTSRGICSVRVDGDARRPTAERHYRISRIHEVTADGRTVPVHSNWRMREMLDGQAAVAELSSYAPGVLAEDGIPVTVTFQNWRRQAPLHWTVVPCALTLGICPYFQHEYIHSEVVVSRDDGKGSAMFTYDECDDWKMSILFAIGSIPYPEKTVTMNEFQVVGHGDVLAKSQLEGLGKGIATVLSGLESKGLQTDR